MSTRVVLHHQTRYIYDRPVRLSIQTVRLCPAPQCKLPVVRYRLQIAPEPGALWWVQDAQGNYAACVAFDNPVDHFQIDSDLTLDIAVINPFDFVLEPSAERYPFAYEAAVQQHLGPYMRATNETRLLSEFLARVRLSGEETVRFVSGLNRQISEQIHFVVRSEGKDQSSAETLRIAAGTTRDMNTLLVDALRLAGMAARFVSGYLIELETPEQASYHLWTEAYLPGAGWIGLDPTSGLFTADNYCPLAVGGRYRVSEFHRRACGTERGWFFSPHITAANRAAR
jgi:transglutaminase-like putative cysteine protease